MYLLFIFLKNIYAPINKEFTRLGVDRVKP